MTLRDDIREHFANESVRFPAPHGLESAVAAHAKAQTEVARRVQWIPAAVAILLGIAIVAGLLAAGSLRHSRTSPNVPAGTVPAAPPSVVAGSGAWTRINDMSTPRVNFTATLLKSGKVLIVGGQRDWMMPGDATNSVEIYDPTSRTFTKVASLGIPRGGHTATRLLDGRVLVAGGFTSQGTPALSSTEIYDPANDTWTPGAPMSIGRAQPAAVLLKSGKVLVVGGGQTGVSGTGTQAAGTLAEIYDPSRDAWSPAGNMTYGRAAYPTATLLADGRVLVVGGRALINSPDLAVEKSEIYDPFNNRWSAVQPNNRTGARQDQSATLLSNGDVIIAGGAPNPDASVSYSDLFAPKTNSWISVPNMHNARCGQGAVLLPTGNAMVIGGGCGWADQSSGVEEFNWSTNTWTPVASLSVPRGRIQAVVLADGTVLALGGLAPSGSTSAIVELFHPSR
jgi:Kelch motif/Galactose oxidase, central domain